MRPSQVLDMQGDLLSRLDDSRFVRVTRECFSLDLGSSRRSESDAIQKNAAYLTAAHTLHVKASEVYRVDPGMMPLLRHAASVLDSSDTFDRSLAPTGAGIVRFDDPILITDIRGRLMKAHWLIWGPVRVQDSRRPTTLLTWYNDSADPDEVVFQGSGELTEVELRTLGRWRWIGADYRMDGSEVGDPTVEASEEQAALVEAEGDTSTSSTNLIRYAHALWLLLNQTIVAKEPEQIERAAARRARKMNLPGRITTIKLRRTQHQPSSGHSEVEWQHRWIVKGHWRWQACGPHYLGAQEVKPGVYRVRLWINPFVKGPEDAPFKQTKKIYSLDR